MIFLSHVNLSLPLQNPILIFAIILFIILFAPIILNKLKIPHLIGLIIAGAIIGPNGFNLMDRDSSIVLFGTVGLLYIMFTAGLEIDLGDFKKNSGKSLVFGLLSFAIPMIFGTLSGYYLLDFNLQTSILLSSLLASHTLLAYPIVSQLGLSKNLAVNITVGGTMITDILALLVLAVIVGMQEGEINQQFWITLVVSFIIFALIVLVIFPIIGRWFFKRFNDNVSQYIFVLALVFTGAFLAELAGIEGIIGAFLAGLALNRLVPHTSALMNRIDFVGNALFIPFFLIGVGMLIDYRAFFSSWSTIYVASIMIVAVITAKYIAAWITQKLFKFGREERSLIYGLSLAQAAATLAAVLVGYNVIVGYNSVNEYGDAVRSHKLIVEKINDNSDKESRNKTYQEITFKTEDKVVKVGDTAVSVFSENEVPVNGVFASNNGSKLYFSQGNLTKIEVPNRLLNENVLNGTILMIIITCTIASVVTQRASQKLAVIEIEDDPDSEDEENNERILIPINRLETVNELIDLSVTVKAKKNKDKLYVLNVIDSENEESEGGKKKSLKILEQASITAAATDNKVEELLRYDSDISSGIINVIKENKISDLVLGLHRGKDIADHSLGELVLQILDKSDVTTLICKSVQPLSTVKRHIVILPENAEREIGFPYWIIKVWNLARNTGAKLIFYGGSNTLNFIRKINSKHPVESEFREFSNWDDFLILSRDILQDDNIIILMSRKNRISYDYRMEKIPTYLSKYFKENSVLLIYPIQAKDLGGDRNLYDATMLEPLEKIDEIGKTISNLFKRK